MLTEFISTRFKNILSYGNNITEFYFQEGLNLITATNGSGKSSILEALTFCLYGRPYRSIKIDQLINDKNGSKLWTETVFRKDNDIYRVERGLKPAILKIFKNDIEMELLSHKNLIQDDLDKILGANYSLFKQLISLSILNNKPFLTLDAKDKRDILESIFNIKIFGKMLKTLKKSYTILKSSAELNDKEINLMKENLQGLINQIKSLRQAKDDFESQKQNEVNQLTIKIENFDQELAKIELAISELNLDKLKIELPSLKKLKNIAEDLLGSWIENNQELKSLKEKIDFLADEIDLELCEKKIPGMFKDCHEIDKEINELINQEKIINSSENKKVLNEIREFEIEILNEKNKIREVEIRKLDLNYDFLSKNMPTCLSLALLKTKNKINIQNLQNDISNLDKGEGQCDYCKQTITVEHKEEEISIRVNQIESLIKENDSIEIKINNEILKYIDETTKEFNREIKEINLVIKAIEIKINTIKLKDVDDKNIKIYNIKDEIKKLKSKRNELSGKILKDKKIEFEKKLQELEGVKQKINDKTQKNDKEIRKIEQQEKEISELKSSYEKFQIQKQNCLNNINTLRDTLSREQVKKFSIDIEPIVADFEKRKFNYQELVFKNKIIKDKLNIDDIIKSILDEEGIKKFFFSRLIPKLNENINQYLDFFELPLNFKFNDTFEEEIKELNSVRSYFNFSGGERFRIDLSITLSFMELNRMINSFNCNVLFFDELLDTGVDDAGLELVLEKLKFLTEKNKQCTYIISHRQIENSMNIDNIIKIKKTKGFSKIIS